MPDAPDRTAPPGATPEDVQQARVVEAVARLSGTVAHEFNNLLTAILGHAQLLAETVPPDSPDHESVHEILAAGQRATALTRMLLTAGRRRASNPRLLDLVTVLGEAMPLVIAGLGPAHRVETRVATGSAPVVADRGEVEQVVMALVTNARDALPGGGDVVLALERAADARHVRLRVTDAGTGLSEAARAHLYEPFFTTKPRDQGLGLGLALVKATMTRAGGTVTVEDAPGGGTAVTLTFPLAAAGDEAAATP
jgi:two-component system cell cycle sensor histidine kinase/response regulator CckA